MLDNAGPHCDSDFVDHVTTACAQHGFLWKPQAPQMPHANVLDLAVFPSMSHRHGKMCKARSNTPVLADEICEVAMSKWNELPSATLPMVAFLLTEF